MDKKNTILLTVIAVATLLVAVVGATFAYFSVTGTGEGSTAAITSTTGSVGSVSIAATNSTMHINTVASDFAQSLGGTDNGVYWAKAGASTPGASDYNQSETPITAFTLTANGDNTVRYVCTVDVTADTSITGDATAALLTGEYAIRLQSGAADTGLIDTYSTANLSASKRFTIHVVGGSTATITASAKLVNTGEPQNPRLANASIVTNLAVAAFSCETVFLFLLYILYI